MPQTSEWVQQRSAHDPTHYHEPEPGSQRAQPVTPPPRNIDHNGHDSHPAPPQPGLATRQKVPKRTYDIATLLGMRHTQGAVPVMLRVKPEAIAENIFQHMGASTSRRLPARSRGLSDISNVSRGSIRSNAANNIGHQPLFDSKPTGMNRLQRQAPSPINIPLSQRNDGFVRFLQQHASPPHHRVTAGGRIVPAGPTSPPPMLDYNSLNGLVRERGAATGNPQKEVPAALYTPKPNDTQSQPMSSMNPRTYAPNYSAGVVSHSGCPASSIQPIMPHENTAYSYQPFMSPAMQTPTSMVPLGVFPDGSILVSCNGVGYRTYCTGVNTVMEPLQSFQPSPEQATYTAAYPQTAYNVVPYGLPLLSSQAPQVPLAFTNITNGSRASNRNTSSSACHESSIDGERELKSQLTNLDKHLALYHFEISPIERAELVAHRRYLVEAINKLRVSKEKTKRSISMTTPIAEMPMTPVRKTSSVRKGNPSMMSSLRGKASHNQARGKGLSPAAPPFVPGSIRGASSENSTKRTLEDIASAAVARKDKALNAYEPSGSTQVISQRECSSSSVLDPSDPAMRVVDYEDVEYASRYLFNWNLEKRRYCTAVPEFQEAIKQVREQARRYGCLGGQSKDPAYDAEQDIWWAICDRDPIPLPPTVPDYVSNPRPWNWEDSVFNFRRKGAPPAGREVDDARRSPRLMGWDPATTESMKDIFDVTRSYYACKGQLPSVPFRTWAYDRKGKKVAIESEPASTAKGGFQSTHVGPSSINGIAKVVQNAAAAPSRALKSLSTNEINSRGPNSAMSSQTQDDEKVQTTGGDNMPQSAPNTLNSTLRQAKLDAGVERSLTSYLTRVEMGDTRDVKHPETPRRSFQPYVEDHPETPVTYHSSLKSKETPILKSDQMSVSPAQTSKSKAPKIIIESAWDPIWDGEYPIYDSRNINYPKFASWMDRGRQSAETRSQWGPEEDSGSLDYKDFTANLGESNSHAKPGERPKIAKVNIPPAAGSNLQTNASQDIKKAQSVNNLTPESTNAQSFLRKMLQSPTYTTARPQTGASSGLAERLSRFLKGGGEGAQQGTRGTANKENAPSNYHLQQAGGSVSSKDDRLDLPSALKSDPNTSVTKAQSLASSSYQAYGYLPHHNDAEGTHIASPYPHWGNDAPHQHQEVDVASYPAPSTAYRTTPTSSTFRVQEDGNNYNSGATYHMPMSFGYDGGADSQMPDHDQSSRARQQDHPHFDFKGVTHADYEIKREDPNNAWHKGAVRDYFQDLAAKEREEIQVYRQSLAKDKA